MRRDKGNEGIKRSLPVFTKHYRSREEEEEKEEEEEGEEEEGSLKADRHAAPKDPLIHYHGCVHIAGCHGPCGNTSTICSGRGEYVQDCMCLCMSALVCMSLRSTVSHPGSQEEATDQVM